ncbi:MAG: magnesium transporter [Proteobacteria bacterium]|nr:magnesium transporter [Pseudomonadota bacterium]
MVSPPLNERLALDDLREIWPILAPTDRVLGFRMLDSEGADDFFLALAPLDQAAILMGLPPGERRLWMRMLAPDDSADVLQEVPPEDRHTLMELLDDPTRREVTALLAYAEDAAGGLMSPRFARMRPEMTADEAISYLRRQARTRLETLYYAYVLDSEQHLLGVVSFRDLFTAAPSALVRDVMETAVVTVPEDMDQEQVARIIAQQDLVAVPVLDGERRMRGIVTIDDIVDVVQEEATEDVHKFGGLAALDQPYMQTSLWTMIRARAVWLSVLFVGEMLTASAMAHFEQAVARAVVLALFVPLIISSGGNSGSQAATLVIRAMALGEVKLRDWWRIMRRELTAGFTLGSVLALFGLLRIILWQLLFQSYGRHYLLLAATVSGSLIGIVTFGTLSGSMLPFLLRRLGFDPASASAPLVATLVDVTGLVLYFSLANVLLRGTLL